ncbi:MAG: DNA gyrase C-terminal beta-propeller domain-containing protein, partial [Bacillota bacterium]|nr:DNA gyrase C-terminal beta-propeller domain-containing protein [Bacillota bacterium]
LDSEKELLKVIRNELSEIVEKYGDDRRTKIIEDDTEAKIDIEELIVVEDTMITMSKEGYIKRIPLKSYNRSNTDTADIEYREGDFNKFLLQSNTRDSVLFFTDLGNMYQLKGVDVPEYKWKEKGERLDDIIKGLNLDAEKIVAAFSVPNLNADQSLLLLTSKGYIKKTSLDKFSTSYTKLMALKLKEDDRLIVAELISNDREGAFIDLTTKCKLNFTVEEPELEGSDRNILGTPLVTLGSKDEILSASFSENGEFASFTLGITAKGQVKVLDNLKAKSDYKINTASNEILLIFADNGVVYRLPAYMLQNVMDEINLGEFIDEFTDGVHKILEVVSIKDFKKKINLYFFTKKGLVKKTALADFEGTYLSTMAYKFKGEDVLISIKAASENDSSALIITKKAMAIRFAASSISEMGRVASGVTGISLKEDDEVVFGAIITEGTKVGGEVAVTLDSNMELKLLSGKKEEKIIGISDIKLQNRAGRGNSMMLIVLDDFIKNVKII